MAAQVYRASLASREGLVTWDGQWYAGHYMPAYSILMPLLGGVTGAWWAGAIACVASGLGLSAVATQLSRGDRSRALAGAVLFSTGAVAALWCGRTTFLLGVAIASFALAAFLSRRTWMWVPLALLTAAASPVAALFLAVCASGFIAGRRRRAAIALAGCSMAPAILLAALFPEGGSQPFNWMQFAPILVGCAVALALAPRKLAELRVGVTVYLLLACALFVIETPVGGNVARLGALAAAPTVALVGLAPGQDSRRLLPLLLGLGLVWQWTAPVVDNIRVAGDRSTGQGFYQPLIGELARQQAQPGRVEVVWTRSHWESALLAPSWPLARGWERQLDRRFNADVNGASLRPRAFRRWLDRLAVRWVALPTAPLDLSASGEAKLVSGGLPWLVEVWRSKDWRLFEVAGASPVANGPAVAKELLARRVTLEASGAGYALVRVRWNRLWRASGAATCAMRGPDGMTIVHLKGPGEAVLAIGGIRGSPSPCPAQRR